MPSVITIDANDALVVVNLGGASLPSEDAIAPLVSRLARAFDNVVYLQDGRPPERAAAASTPAEEGGPLKTTAELGGESALWPGLCSQGALGGDPRDGAAFERRFSIMRKGVSADGRSPHASRETDRASATSLAHTLKALGIRRVFACGQTTDYCVAYSALEARAAGLVVFIIDDACATGGPDGPLDGLWARMNSAEVWRIQAREILG